MGADLTIGERIAWYRRRRGMSQEVLAGRVGRTVDWLSKIENNRIGLDRLSIIMAVTAVLDVTVGDLLADGSASSACVIPKARLRRGQRAGGWPTGRGVAQEGSLAVDRAVEVWARTGRG
jgi:transcriptional regulator with XRE-family HTH domain